MRRQKINEVIPNWAIGEGIFHALQSFPVPWQYENISESLDLEYHGNISGDKYISPLVRKFKVGEVITSDELIKVAGVIYTLYGKNWAKEWETMSLEYNPIENYSMVEKMIDDVTEIERGTTHTRTDNTTHTKTGTETNTPNLTERVTPNVTNSNSNSVYGFNSSSPVPSDSSTGSQTGQTTTTNTGTNTMTHNVSDKDTGTVTDKDTGKDTNTRNYTLTRSGNIGVTTSQQMIQSSRDLYMWNIFYTVIFPDIDKVISLPIY